MQSIVIVNMRKQIMEHVVPKVSVLMAIAVSQDVAVMTIAEQMKHVILLRINVSVYMVEPPVVSVVHKVKKPVAPNVFPLALVALIVIVLRHIKSVTVIINVYVNRGHFGAVVGMVSVGQVTVALIVIAQAEKFVCTLQIDIYVNVNMEKIIVVIAVPVHKNCVMEYV